MHNSANNAKLHVLLKHYASLAVSKYSSAALSSRVLQVSVCIPLSKVCPYVKCTAKADIIIHVDRSAEFIHGKYRQHSTISAHTCHAPSILLRKLYSRTIVLEILCVSS